MKILRALADGHRRRQEALSRVLRTECLTAWSRYRAAPPGPEAERAWSATVTRLIHKYGLASAELAAGYYEEARQAAGVTRSFTVPVAEPPHPTQINAARKALRASAAPRPDGGEDGPEAVEGWRVTQRDREVAAAQRLAAQAGRRTIEKAARADPEAVGWVRVTGGNACAFCALLAMRGLVFADRTRARRTATGDPYHDRCACTAEPVFRGRAATPEPEIAEWEELYYEASHGVYGAEKQRAFRRAYDAKYGKAQ
ncbi:VG15 protein [Streptomyces hiroshimensis]|uniref:Uncharacterized protein n=1 Tax=Streptomyces hiroshimensis TaxID=66424 RepID=A0ABQ2Y548_9ACTN|nr:hypothetical protein [Streptomyces hiroshimensis]GGX63264.1 hypothetical protein GCM10010324_05020 [Streptomyces hiroshimensis]